MKGTSINPVSSTPMRDLKIFFSFLMTYIDLIILEYFSNIPIPNTPYSLLIRNFDINIGIDGFQLFHKFFFLNR